MKPATTLPLILSLLLFSGCAATQLDEALEKGARQLSGAEIEALVAGNTVHLDEHGDLADIEFYPNGALRVIENTTTDVETVGRWGVDDQARLCYKVSRWGETPEACYPVYDTDDTYRQYASNGALVSIFTVSEGTSQGPPPAPKKRIRRPKAGKAGGDEPEATTAQPLPPPRPTPPTPAPAPLARPPVPPLAEDRHADKDIRFIYREMAKNCPGCDLSRIDLTKAGLVRANLAGADLSGANLQGANLRRANLKGASLVEADLRGANLAGADLRGADLTRARLDDAVLSKADLRGALLNDAEGADLGDAIR